VEGRRHFELSACPFEMPVDRLLVQANGLGDLSLAQAFCEEADDPLFGQRKLGNRHGLLLFSTTG
jgi:hypothetical protein